ncbi:MAG: hypothetical protein IKF71_05575 [Bacilli bacterium]|nr:hypothetical protein [Bacilli bacterium]
MKIQRGIVKYKDRNDIVCTYALTDDGKQYYFLDETETKKISNGNRIATTQLVEAIDPMVKAANVGVIDQNGAVIVPFENRSIRLANENLLIVEKAEPTSQNVLDAIELRNDPTAAAQLVSTPAAIKDRIKAQMGVEGNYLFNDQFSEATICDANGTNLVQGENYSFICMANDRLYLSKNNLDSPISEFSLTTYELTEAQPVAAPVDAIDVSAATVDPQVVEGALNSESVAVQNPAMPAEGIQSEPIAPSVPVVEAEPAPVDAVVPSTEETPMEAITVPEVAPPQEAEGVVASGEEATEEAPKEDIIHEFIDIPETEATEEASQATESTPENGFSDDLKAFTNGTPAGEEPVAESDAPPIVEEENADSNTVSEEAPKEEDIIHEVIDVPQEEETAVDLPPEESHEEQEEIFSPTVTANNEEDNESSNQTAPVNIDAETVFATVDRNQNGIIDSDEVMVPQQNHASTTPDTMLSNIFNTPTSDPKDDFGLPNPFDSTYTPSTSYGSFNSMIADTKPYDSYGPLESDHLMSDVARSMAELMKRNKEQRGAISQYQSKIENLEAQSRILSEKYKDQSMRYETLSNKLRSMEDTINRAEARNQLLENKVRDQEKLIASQEREIKILRPQVEGKQDLVRLLADARTLLGTDSGYGFDDGSNYYGGRVA